MRKRIKSPMRSKVTIVVNRMPQVVRTIGILGFRRLLHPVSDAREVAIAQARRDAVADNRFDGWKADEVLAPWMVRRPDDRLGGDLRLKNRRHRLRASTEAALHPVELRRIQCRQLHHRYVHLTAIVQQLRAQRIAETLDRVLGGAVRRLQRDAAIGERRADLHDDAAIARLHPPQRRQRSVDDAEIGDLGDGAVFVRLHLDDGREDARHGVVDPYVDGPELLFERGRSLFNCVGVGDIRLQHQRASPGMRDVARRAFEPCAAAGEQPYRCAAARKQARDGAADAS